jgi:hypothetical protein
MTRSQAIQEHVLAASWRPPVGGRYQVTRRWQSATVLGFGTQMPRTAHLAEVPKWVNH